MKKIFYLTMGLILMFQLSACGNVEKAYDIDISEEKLMPIYANLKGHEEPTINYQGYLTVKIKMDEKEANNVIRVIVQDIKFEGKLNGLETLYRHNNYFDEQAIEIIYNDIVKGNGIAKYVYEKENLKDYGFYYIDNLEKEEYATKLQYALLGMNINSKGEDLKRILSFNIVYELKDGSKIEKHIRTEIN